MAPDPVRAVDSDAFGGTGAQCRRALRNGVLGEG